MIKFMLKHKYLIVFILIIILFIPYSLYQVPETERLSVITSVGLDKVEDGIQLSANTIVPNSGTMSGGGGSDGTVKTIVVKGKNVGDAFSNLSLILGRLPGLAHCDSIVINKELMQEDVTKYLDYFVRTNNLTSNATLIVAENTAKEIIETTASQKGLRAITLSDVLLLNHEYVLTKKSNLDVFYANYFSKAPSMALPILNVGESNQSDDSSLESGATTGSSGTESSGSGGQNQNNQSQNSGQGSGQDENKDSSQQGGQSAPSKILKNEGKGAIVNKGKLVGIVEGKQMQGLSLLSKTVKKGNVQVDNINDEIFNDATLNFDIFNKSVKHYGYFANGVPVFNYDITLVLKLDEVVMDDYSVEAMTAVKNYMKGNIKELTESTICGDISSIINKCKSTKSDILSVYDYFYKFHTTEWNKFLDNLEDKEDYLNYVVFTCDLKPQGKI